MKHKKSIFALMPLFFFGLSAVAKMAPDVQDHSHFLSKLKIPYEKFVLENGLQVILSPDEKSPFVAVNVWYHVGANDEVVKQTGKAHLLEHLMFEGSEHIAQDAHFKILDSVGAFASNASTGFERTNYYQTVPKHQLPLALALESDRMSLLKIDQAKLDEQREVVRREREQRYESAPYGIATLKLWEEIFKSPHPMHGRVIGSHSDLQAASVKDVQNFYDKHYGPSNATLTLVGGFQPSEAKTLIKKYFATLPKTQKVAPKTLPKIEIKGEKVVHVDEKLGKLTLVRMQWITPKLFAKGDAELDLVSEILTGNQNARLTKALKYDEQLVNVVSAYQRSMGQISIFTVDAILNPYIDPKTVIAKIDAQLVGLTTTLPSDKEIERARNTILTSQIFGLQQVGGNYGLAEILQSYNFYANDPGYLSTDVSRYFTTDKNEVATSVRKYLGPNRKILIATPISARVATKE